MKSIRVLPEKGKKIRDPKTFKHLDSVIPLAVKLDVFWSRRIKCKDVKEVKRDVVSKPKEISKPKEQKKGK